MKLFKQHKPALVFSVYKGDCLKEDKHNHRQCAEALEAAGIPFKVVDGRFNRKQEQSFVVSNSAYERVVKICHAYQQDALLYLDEYRKAYLIGVSNSTNKYLGQWQTAQPRHYEDYSFDRLTKRYYVVR